jgi:hypothetical protein
MYLHMYIHMYFICMKARFLVCLVWFLLYWAGVQGLVYVSRMLCHRAASLAQKL